MNEVRPTIVCHIDVGTFVDDIDFDVERIVEHMHSRDFTDEQIAAVTISADRVENVFDANNTSLIHRNLKGAKVGAARLDTMEAMIFPEPTDQLARILVPRARRKDPSLTIDQIFSKRISQALGHELEHLKVGLEGGIRTGRLRKALGLMAMMTVETARINYVLSAEEIRCRKAGREAPHDLVRIRYKKSALQSM